MIASMLEAPGRSYAGVTGLRFVRAGVAVRGFRDVRSVACVRSVDFAWDALVSMAVLRLSRRALSGLTTTGPFFSAIGFSTDFSFSFPSIPDPKGPSGSSVVATSVALGLLAAASAGLSAATGSVATLDVGSASG